MMKHLEETPLIESHLSVLITKFSLYFPEEKFRPLQDLRWVRNPFDFEAPESLMPLNLTTSAESELLHLTCDGTLKTRHGTEKLSSFWISLSDEYPVLSKASILLLLPFTTTYMCEAGFSVLTKIKTKQRNRLNSAPDMGVTLLSCKVDSSRIVQNRQAHPSH